MNDLPEDIHQHLEDTSEFFDDLRNDLGDKWNNIENCQPDKFSWITFEISNVSVATNVTSGIHYGSNQRFRAEALRFLAAFLDDKIVNYLREGKLTGIQLNIGPQLSSENINEAVGLDPFPTAFKQK